MASDHAYKLRQQKKANESIQRINIDGFGEVRQARPAARFSKTPTKLSRPAPKLGEHTHEVLSDIGINETERKNLLDKKIIVSS